MAFLLERDVSTAMRARQTLDAALSSLADLPERGRPAARGRAGLRELPVRFGRYGYAIRYEVNEDEVFVTRIFHALESR